MLLDRADGERHRDRFREPDVPKFDRGVFVLDCVPYPRIDFCR